ncbi:hypothetical protein BS78_05G169400 [Paspalum vaginatum]|nr:hypothetical protein BS78_05G169400 [Paspalum vaginatum]
MRQQAAETTDAELLEALARRRWGQPPAPSQPFTVHDAFIFDSHPARLYDENGRGAGCVYFFSEPRSTTHYLERQGERGWKVAGGTRRLMDGGGREVGSKDTLVFHEGRWLPRTRWAMDEFDEHKNYQERELRLYRLRRLA